MQVEIWSDVVCPWCYIGKHRFEKALEGFEHRDEVEVRWRSFELDPQAPRVEHGDHVEYLANKYRVNREQALASIARVVDQARGEGLEYAVERIKRGNTFDAHRLLHHAADRGVQNALAERLFRAHFAEGEPIGDTERLTVLASEAGLDADAARAVLDGDDHSDAVRADEQEAATMGIRSVPTFVVDRRYKISGAQPVPLLQGALAEAYGAGAAAG